MGCPWFPPKEVILDENNSINEMRKKDDIENGKIENQRILISSENLEEKETGVDLTKASCFAFKDVTDEASYLKIEKMLLFNVEFDDYLSQLFPSNKNADMKVTSYSDILDIKLSKEQYLEFLLDTFKNAISEKDFGDVKLAFDIIYNNLQFIFKKEYGKEQDSVNQSHINENKDVSVYKFHLVYLGFLLCKHERKSKIEFITEFFTEDQVVSSESFFTQFLLVLLVFSTLSMYDICNALSNRFGSLNKEEIEKRKKYNYEYFILLIEYFKVNIFGRNLNSSYPDELKDLKQEDFKAVFQKNGFCWPFSPLTIRMYVGKLEEDELKNTKSNNENDNSN